MHFLTIVVVPPGYDGDPVDYVHKALEPFNEQLDVEPYTDEDGETYWCNPQGFWDWYQIGGRWQGHLIPNYDPDDDLRNWQVCNTCDGTGTRPGGREQFGAQWFADMNGCNGCMGKGRRMKWPTEWVDSGGNIARLGDVRGILEEGVHHIVHEGVTSAERRNPDWRSGDGFDNYWLNTRHEVSDVLAKLCDDCTVVVVDTHC